MNKGILFVFSGPSGVGKDTVLDEFLADNSQTIRSISATTRPIRSGETDGKDYFFWSKDQFQQRIREGQMLEYASYSGNFYGTPRQFVEDTLKAGKNVLLKIEVQGALQVKELFPKAVLIFIMPPSFEELKRRLTGRGTDDPESIRKRLNAAVEEIKCAAEYDYIIVNDKVENACKQLAAVISAAEHQVKFYEKFMEEVRLDAKTSHDPNA